MIELQLRLPPSQARSPRCLRGGLTKKDEDGIQLMIRMRIMTPDKPRKQLARRGLSKPSRNHAEQAA